METTKKIYVIKNTEIEASTLEEAKTIYNKANGVETFIDLQQKAYKKLDELKEEISNYGKENVKREKFKVFDDWKMTIEEQETDDIWDFVRIARDDTKKRTCWRLKIRSYDWSSEAFEEVRKFTGNDYMYGWTKTIIYAETKKEYKTFINNFEETKEEIMTIVKGLVKIHNKHLQAYVDKRIAISEKCIKDNTNDILDKHQALGKVIEELNLTRIEEVEDDK